MILRTGWQFNPSPFHSYLPLYSLVPSLSHVWFFATPWNAECQASLSKTKPGACSNSCPSSRWCHPTISPSVVPVSSCLQSFPASGSLYISFQLQPWIADHNMTATAPGITSSQSIQDKKREMHKSILLIKGLSPFNQGRRFSAPPTEILSCLVGQD